MSFHRYQHLERIGTDEVEGIDEGACYIFPKIDGTNASVWFYNGEIKCGSRNRVLSLDNDNQGFMAHIMVNKEKYEAFFAKYPNVILYGEFLVKHTIGYYRENAYKQFYVFDVAERISPNEIKYLHYEDYRHMLYDFNIEYVPTFGCWEFPTDDVYHKVIKENKYLIPDDEDKVGEGIVIKRYDFKNKYGKTKWAKIVCGEFKENSRKIPSNKTNVIYSGALEKDIVDKYVTKEFVLKEKAKLGGAWSSRRIPEMLSRVFHELVTEETWNFVKENKYPVIDFKLLNRFCIMKVKQHLDL